MRVAGRAGLRSTWLTHRGEISSARFKMETDIVVSVRIAADIDDVFETVKDIAKKPSPTLGRFISALVRQSFGKERSKPPVRNSVPLFGPKPVPRRPDLSLVNALRDEQ